MLGENRPDGKVLHRERVGLPHRNDNPVKVLQIGEGNFLRGFVDWMVHEANRQGLFQGSIAVVQPRPSGKHNITQLNLQDGLFTLVTRGFQNGAIMNRQQVISVISHAIDPYEHWDEFLTLAEVPTLEFVISNTTEAGLQYTPTAQPTASAVESFPAKLAAFLYRRYQFFRGDPTKGLVVLPCELVEQNGQTLKRYILQHSLDWGLSADFLDWVRDHNVFLNNLVDRIVTGFPTAEAADWFEAFGYIDGLLNVAEPYHLWVIEGDPALGQRLPLAQAGLNVHWVDDLTPFQTRKVRLLNGAHTMMAAHGILHGLTEVQEMMAHPQYGPWVREAMVEEIIPSLPYDAAGLMNYSNEVLERFQNPFLHHRLLDISLNSVSKFVSRVLPTLNFWIARGELPLRMVEAFAGVIRFYAVTQRGANYFGSTLNGDEYPVRDRPDVLAFFAREWSDRQSARISLTELVDHVLGNRQLWGQDLSDCGELGEALVVCLEEMEGSC